MSQHLVNAHIQTDATGIYHKKAHPLGELLIVMYKDNPDRAVSIESFEPALGRWVPCPLTLKSSNEWGM